MSDDAASVHQPAGIPIADARQRSAILEGSRVARHELEAQVDTQSAHHYAANTPWSALALVVATALLAALLWAEANRTPLMAWSLLVVSASVAHAGLLAGRLQMVAEQGASGRLKAVNASLWLAAGGIGFGLLPFLHDIGLADIAVVLTLLAALVVLALPRMAAVFAPFIGFSLLTLGPPAAWVLIHGASLRDGPLAVLGASAFVMLAVLLIAHRGLHRAIQGSLWMAVEQRALLRRLERANRELYADRAALQTESRTDPLTGLANRRSLEESLDLEWNRCRRERQPLSCVMLDIDHFKSFNDRYGHDGGDACLRQISGVLKRAIRRAGDVAARFGGEEFVVLLPNTDLAGAETVAAQLRAAVGDERIPHEASETAHHVTISLGAACLVPNETALPLELLKAADLALYEAKRGGRNRVEVADGPMHESARMAARGMIG